MTKPDVIRDVTALRKAVSQIRSQGRSIALVPTMGALHDGHLDLVLSAQSRAHHVIVSIFVDPTQFAAHEDLGTYPRQEAADLAALASVGAHIVYAPTAAVMYPEGFATRVQVSGVSEPLEGAFRPHFFGGVATVVTKLLTQTAPDFAIFGEKDWQQLQVVRTLARDLDLDVEIIGVPTRRDPDGLALSSRNAYLSAAERAVAPLLKQALDAIAQCVVDIQSPETRVAQGLLDDTIAQQKARLEKAGFGPVDYLEVRHAHTLAPWRTGDPARVLAAVWLSKTRLIDNCAAGTTAA